MIKQKTDRLQEEIGNQLEIPHSSLSNQQNKQTEKGQCKKGVNTISQVKLINIYKTFHPNPAESTFFTKA